MKKERITNFEVFVTLTLDWVIWRTVMYQSSTFTYITNFVQIEKKLFVDRQMGGHKYGIMEIGHVRLT